MSRIRYDGPGRVLEAFGRTLNRGEEAEFSKSETRSLLSQPHIRIAVDGKILAPLDPPPPADVTRPSVHGSRRQWAAYAAKQGVTVIDEMTRDEIVAVIDGATGSGDEPLEDENEVADTSVLGEPEAQMGEGHPKPDKETK